MEYENEEKERRMKGMVVKGRTFIDVKLMFRVPDRVPHLEAIKQQE